jgi:hypothetical protein
MKGLNSIAIYTLGIVGRTRRNGGHEKMENILYASKLDYETKKTCLRMTQVERALFDPRSKGRPWTCI